MDRNWSWLCSGRDYSCYHFDFRLPKAKVNLENSVYFVNRVLSLLTRGFISVGRE